MLGSSPRDNYIAMNMKDLNFTSSCISYEYGLFGSNSIEFVINITYANSTGYLFIKLGYRKEYQFRILKTLPSIKDFTKSLEIQLGRTLPASMLPSFKDCKSNQSKMQFVDYYFKNLLSNQDFYCPLLFDYINFNIIKKTEIVKDLDDNTAISP